MNAQVGGIVFCEEVDVQLIRSRRFFKYYFVYKLKIYFTVHYMYCIYLVYVYIAILCVNIFYFIICVSYLLKYLSIYNNIIYFNFIIQYIIDLYKSNMTRHSFKNSVTLHISYFTYIIIPNGTI